MVKMDRLRFCMCLTLLFLLFLRSETCSLNPNIDGSNQSRSIPALVKGANKELLNCDIKNEDPTTDRQIPGGPDAKHHYEHQK
uniref:Uncharacterized protein n=1 Tax=Quercus lobata TaxID=97700 RepID=A0A7N2LNX7_QUELO